jgi:hypothetical protein
MKIFVGMLGCWDVGMLGCWDVGMLGCWDVGQRYSGDWPGKALEFEDDYQFSDKPLPSV